MENLIELKKIIKKYDKVVLNDININIKKGERIALIGANGSGKTTLSEIIADIRKPTKGKKIVNSKTIVGIQFQDTKFPFGIKVIDMIKYYLQSFNIEMNSRNLYDLLVTYQIDEFKNKFISDLSGGQQQRINILLAMIHKPDVIILDEVSTGLDIQVREEIFQFIQKEILNKDITIILVTHMMDEVERFCNRLIFIHEGKIIEDSPVEKIVKKNGSVQNYVMNKLEKLKQIDLEKMKQIRVKHNIYKMFNKKSKVEHKAFGLYNLIYKYIIRNKVIPLFIIFYPIISLFLIGRAIPFFAPPKEILLFVKSLIIGIALIQVIANGIFIVPEIIIEYKKSVLMKRIGATGIKPVTFGLTIVLVGFIITLFSYLWSMVWSAIIFVPEYGWSILSLKETIFALPLLLLILISTISFGLMLSVFFKTSSAFLAGANLIYIVIGALIGGFFPYILIEQSPVLNKLIYINPFYYVTVSYWDILLNRFVFDWKFYTFLGISAILLILYSLISIRGLKWQN